MVLSAFLGLLCGLVVSIGVAAYFDSEIVAICVPSLILIVLTSATASGVGVLKTLSKSLLLQLLAFAGCVTLATLFCTEHNWGQFGAPEYVLAPKAFSMALNTLVSVSLSAPLFYIFELWFVKSSDEFRLSEKFIAIPGFCSAYYLAAALPLVLLAHHSIHSACFGFDGLMHTFMTKEALKVVIAISTIPLSSAIVFLSMIVMRRFRERQSTNRF